MANEMKKIFKKIYYFISYRLIPPKTLIRIRFKIVFGFFPSFKDPKTFNEKLQWKKFYDHKKIYTLCSDKYLVRNYVKKIIGEKYLIPILQCVSDPSKIDFDKLPNQFIIKSNHASGQIIIVKNKNEINKKEILKKCKGWLKINFYYYGIEWQYKNIKPKIIIERLMLDENNKIPNDFKFHCFNGKVEFIQLDTGRFNEHKRTLFNKNWNILKFQFLSYKRDKRIKKPSKLKHMIKLCEKISKSFDYIRVDLYNIKNKIYFGELTFTPEAGFGNFSPNKYDLVYGQKLKLNKTNNH